MLEGNTRRGRKHGREYTFTVPSPATYPFQWFWDSCFHAIVWAHFDVERAKEELRSLLAWQREDGFIPHVIFWDRRRALTKIWHWLESERWLGVPALPLRWGKPATSAMMQPPVIAQAVERVYEASGDRDFVVELLPALAAYYGWLASARDPDGDGLISIVAPFESGLDFSPAFDCALRLRDPGARALTARARMVSLRNKLRRYSLPRIFAADNFVVADVLVNSCYVQGLGALARLADVARNERVGGWARSTADRSLAALIARSYDARARTFRNLSGRALTPCPMRTVGSLMPLIVPSLPAEIAGALAADLADSQRFWLRFPVPSVARDEPAFRADDRVDGVTRIWRGTTWINTNWLLARGLRQHGFGDLAEEIRVRSVELVDAHGFREYYNPFSGEPLGAEQFGWSTLVVDM